MLSALKINEKQKPMYLNKYLVKSLTLTGSSLLSLDILSSIVLPQQIQYLDVSDIHRLSPNELENLLAHTFRVLSLSMKFDPLFVIPSQIQYLLLKGQG
ncbi:unnamed protein product [Rotaria sordida]|uniref:Uncharacterized protein n=1 Tax=Rotaria sordida TaxID=392033 RepID=A0A815G9Q1_9BILA|nr:unnamed protein product [Rotaria sordida]CAF1335970.1 unnamed protein product [Rotaria sordida]